MPRGKLFFRTKATIAAAGGNNTTGLYSYGGVTGWADAYERYGVSLEPGGLDAIMAPAPNKDPDGSTSVGISGTAYDGSTIGFKAERSLSFDIHIVASGKEDYLSKYARFISEVLDGGYFQMRTDILPLVYHLLYQNCQQFRQFLSGMAKFTITAKEPHPEIRDVRTPGIMV